MKSVYRNVLGVLSLGIILSFSPGNLSPTSLAQDPCQKIIDAIASLEERVLGLEDELRDASGVEITVLRSRIKTLKQRIKKEQEVLDRCIKDHSPMVAGSEDEIRLLNKIGSDQATVLVDGRRDTGCSNDEVFSGRFTLLVGNILSNQGCIPEVAVFAQNNAMQIVSPLNVWTNQNTDRLDVRMADRVRVPLVVWVLQGPFTMVQDQVNADVARANQLFGTMQAGVQVVPVTINNATANPNAESLLNSGCISIDSLKTKIGFTPKQINAYYIETALFQRGGFCPGTSIILIGATVSDNESLAHEIGHAFSLGHTAEIPGIPQTNLMASGGINRDSITTGQCFRINVNSTSVINVNGNRTATTRDCPDDAISNLCPSLALDVQPK